MKEKLKLLAKIFIPLAGALLLFFFGRRANKNGYEKRVLVIFGGGIGDVVKRSVICSYIERYLKEYGVYYLMPYRIKLPHAKETIYFDYKKAKIDPLYYVRTVNSLRKIGFSKIIVVLPFWDGFLPSLASDIAPETIFCTQESEPNSSYRMVGRALSLVRPRLFSKTRFIKVASEYDGLLPAGYFPSDVWKHVYFISRVLCDIDPRNKVSMNKDGLLENKNIRTEIESGDIEVAAVAGLGDYCVIGLGSSYAGKNWPAKKFGAIAEFLFHEGFAIVLVGGPESLGLVEDFRTSYQGPFTDLINATTLDGLCSVIKNSFLVIGNDTSFIHVAIALKRPTFCIGYNTSGVDTNYGYEDINTWALSRNISETSVEVVEKKAQQLVDYLKKTSHVPLTRFQTSFSNDI